MHSRSLILTLTLLLFGALAMQVAPFLVIRGPGPESCPALPEGMSRADMLRAEAFSRPFVVAGLGAQAANLLGLMLLLAMLAPRPGGSGAIAPAQHGRPALRAGRAFAALAGVYLFLFLLGLPLRVSAYLHGLAFGQTQAPFAEWARVILLSLPIPMFLFPAKGLMIFACFDGLGRNAWWICALAIFFSFDALPQFFRNQPVSLISRYAPLADQDYRRALEAVASKDGARLNFRVEDQSRRENTVEMSVMGRAGNRCVVLSDTFIEQFTPQEAAAALGHELGHEQHRVRMLIITQLLNLANTAIALALAGWWLRRRPSSGVRAVLAAVLWLDLASIAFGPVRAAVSRWDERAADRHAIELTADADSFRTMLIKGARINLERADIPRWEYFLFSGYPTLRERVSVNAAGGR